MGLFDGFKKKATQETELNESVEAQSNETLQNETINIPVKGEVIELSKVHDEAFAGGFLGNGLAIIPSEGKLYAPCDGVIETFYPTGHAIGIKSNKGAEVLIHVGMDTVKLDGKGFKALKNQSDVVKAGELLLEFDIDVIKEAGYSIETPVIITNTDDYASVTPAGEGMSQPGEVAITLEV